MFISSIAHEAHLPCKAAKPQRCMQTRSFGHALLSSPFTTRGAQPANLPAAIFCGLHNLGSRSQIINSGSIHQRVLYTVPVCCLKNCCCPPATYLLPAQLQFSFVSRNVVTHPQLQYLSSLLGFESRTPLLFSPRLQCPVVVFSSLVLRSFFIFQPTSFHAKYQIQ